MNRTRRLLMVAFVATALSADRLATAAPALRPESMAEATRSVVGRLVVSFRRAVPAVRIIERSSPIIARSSFSSIPPRLQFTVHPCGFAQWQDRLPPPAC